MRDQSALRAGRPWGDAYIAAARERRFDPHRRRSDRVQRSADGTQREATLPGGARWSRARLPGARDVDARGERPRRGADVPSILACDACIANFYYFDDRTRAAPTRTGAAARSSYDGHRGS